MALPVAVSLLAVAADVQNMSHSDQVWKVKLDKEVDKIVGSVWPTGRSHELRIDLDVVIQCLYLGSSYLYDLRDTLRASGFATNVTVIANARVPIVRF
ncbi:hypothetical protein JCM8547_002882 [Rhodosporidiobolus lusitaniae]